MTLQGSTTADGPGLLTEQQAKQLTDRVLAMVTDVDDARVNVVSAHRHPPTCWKTPR
jgi:hypothetical protein